MLKRASSAVQISDGIDESIKNEYGSEPRRSSYVTSTIGQRELNKNFKKVNLSSEVNNLLQNVAEEVTLKQEALINKYKQQQVRSLRLVQTANPNFMRAANGMYYRLNEYEYVEEASVLSVDEAGNYVIESKLNRANDILITTYDMTNKPVAFKIADSSKVIYKSERNVARKLNMKKEYVYPNKLHGYSGNSSGLAAIIKNMLSAPIPSGCYFYRNYTFFKWNAEKCQFEINVREGKSLGSPLMSDYEIEEDMVLRTDYDGAGVASL